MKEKNLTAQSPEELNQVLCGVQAGSVATQELVLGPEFALPCPADTSPCSGLQAVGMSAAPLVSSLADLGRNISWPWTKRYSFKGQYFKLTI